MVRKLILAATLLAVTATAVDAQYRDYYDPYPRPRRYSDERPPPPPPPRPYPRPCWNCNQPYPSDVPKCPYCYSPRDKPR
jgi:hypothetical protein